MKNRFTVWYTQKRGLARGALSINKMPTPLHRSSITSQDLNKYKQWQYNINNSNARITDPYKYWHTRQLKYPRLSRIALDLLTIPPISAECKRLFSITGYMVIKIYNRLDASIIKLCQTLYSWLYAGLITSLDRILSK